MSDERPWTDFHTSRPTERGLYKWRVPHTTLKGIVVTFEATMRMRGAGFETVLSPHFDHWDGWKVVLPKQVEWRPRLEGLESPKNRRSYTCIQVEGIEHEACPFCHGQPSWEADLEYLYGGRDFRAKPYQANRWSLRCCAWAATTPTRSDPRTLVEERNTKLRNPPCPKPSTPNLGAPSPTN